MLSIEYDYIQSLSDDLFLHSTLKKSDFRNRTQELRDLFSSCGFVEPPVEKKVLPVVYKQVEESTPYIIHVVLPEKPAIQEPTVSKRIIITPSNEEVVLCYFLYLCQCAQLIQAVTALAECPEILDIPTYEQVLGWDKDLTLECIEPNPGPKNKFNGNKKRGNRGRLKNNNNNQRVIRQERPNLIMPPRHVASLMYVDGAYVRNNPGNNYLVYSFRINDLYDPDPLILSGSVSGFKELMQFYQYYRVLNFSASIQISNNESFDLMYGAVFSQSNLTGTITSRDDAINALENNYCKGPFLLSEKTGIDRATMNLRIKPANLLGVPRQYHSDTNYIGNGLATPSIPLWLNFIVCTPTGAVLANGYTTTTKFTFIAEFFGRLNLRA